MDFSKKCVRWLIRLEEVFFENKKKCTMYLCFLFCCSDFELFYIYVSTKYYVFQYVLYVYYPIFYIE